MSVSSREAFENWKRQLTEDKAYQKLMDDLDSEFWQQQDQELEQMEKRNEPR